VAVSRMQEAGRKARDRMEQAQRLLDEGWEKNDLRTLADARANAAQAAEIAVGASDAVRAEAVRLQDEITARIASAEKNATLLPALLDDSAQGETRGYEQTESGKVMALAEPSVEEQFAAAFRRWDPDLDIDHTPLEEISKRLQSQPPPVVQEVVAALEAWM